MSATTGLSEPSTGIYTESRDEMSGKIQVRENHATSLDAYANVATVMAQERGPNVYIAEIWPYVAVTIASWWQSSGTVGNVLAAFASGAEVDRTALLDDIDATRREHGYHIALTYVSALHRLVPMAPRDRDALDCLSTFVINYGKSDGEED